MLEMIGRRLQITRCDVCFKHAGKVKRFSGCVTKSVSGGTHGSFFKRSLLLDTVVAKATQRQTTTLLSPSVKYQPSELPPQGKVYRTYLTLQVLFDRYSSWDSATSCLPDGITHPA